MNNIEKSEMKIDTFDNTKLSSLDFNLNVSKQILTKSGVVKINNKINKFIFIKFCENAKYPDKT